LQQRYGDCSKGYTKIAALHENEKLQNLLKKLDDPKPLLL